MYLQIRKGVWRFISINHLSAQFKLATQVFVPFMQELSHAVQTDSGSGWKNIL